MIGRSRRCDLRVDDPQASREHAKISRKGNEYFVQDLGATHMTRVNGVAVQGSTKLRDKDEILIGSAAIIFLLDPEDLVVTTIKSYDRTASLSIIIVSIIAFLAVALLTREVIKILWK